VLLGENKSKDGVAHSLPAQRNEMPSGVSLANEIPEGYVTLLAKILCALTMR
jgi:hypothetical protein